MTEASGTLAAGAARLDLRGVRCPLTWVRTRIALDHLHPGGALEVVLLDGEPLDDLPRTAEGEGHRVALRVPSPEHGQGAWRVMLIKGEAEGTGAPSDAERILP